MGQLFTVGHSTRTLDELIDASAKRRSRRHRGRAPVSGIAPQPPLRASGAGGRAFPRAASTTSGWARWAGIDGAPGRAAITVAGRGLRRVRRPHEHGEFRDGFDAAPGRRRPRPTAIMCAEASPYRCHRRLISDWAELHGIEVVHLLDEHRRERHQVTPFARHAGDGARLRGRPQLALPLG